MSLAQLQEVPPKSMVLLVGPPGAGKSTFCHQIVLSSIDVRPIIYVTTECSPSKVKDSLRLEGLGDVLPHPLAFVDAFHETVGLPTTAEPDMVNASSQDLTSLDVAIYKLKERVGENVLVVFDSLTSPYLMNGSELLSFMRMTLSKLAAEGDAVLTCMDEGCGKNEDLVAMMSTADGIVKIDLMDGSQTFDVIKHPKMKPRKIEVSGTWSSAVPYHFDMKIWAQHVEISRGLTIRPALRTEVGDYVHLFWPTFARWCGMLWDPKRFPTMTYNANKQAESMGTKMFIQSLPWHTKLSLKLSVPKNFSNVKNMKKLISWLQPSTGVDRFYMLEYLENVSKTDEHFVRVHEAGTCWGFENVGATLGLGTLGGFVGGLKGLEEEDRDWNIVETKCIGLGDPYCEGKIAPGEIDGLKDSLESLDSTIMERIQNRLINRLIGFLLYKKPLWERPRMGNQISLHAVNHIMVLPAIASERYRIAMRLGGTAGGKEIGIHLMDAGKKENEAINCILAFLEHCKVGKITMGETIRMVQNCESFGMKSEEPSCFFTTGFLNGFVSTVTNQHVKETKCISMGDPYCEWDFT